MTANNPYDWPRLTDKLSEDQRKSVNNFLVKKKKNKLDPVFKGKKKRYCIYKNEQFWCLPRKKICPECLQIMDIESHPYV